MWFLMLKNLFHKINLMLNFIKEHFFKISDSPRIYALSQVMLAPCARERILKKIDQIIRLYPPGNKILDVGCGPNSYLFEKGLDPIGLDITRSYVEKYKKSGHCAIFGSSDSLPFKNLSFDSVWSFGLLHHLTNSQFKKTVLEVIRVTKSNGYAAIFDAVMPKSFFRHPLAYLIRKMDRGAFMRNEEEILKLLPNVKKWKKERYVYAETGLELLILTYKK